MRAYLKDPEKWEAKKAAAAKEQEGGAGKPGRKKRGKASTGGGNGYTGPQWERMMGYAAEVGALWYWMYGCVLCGACFNLNNPSDPPAKYLLHQNRRCG